MLRILAFANFVANIIVKLWECDGVKFQRDTLRTQLKCRCVPLGGVGVTQMCAELLVYNCGPTSASARFAVIVTSSNGNMLDEIRN